jgi:hypothetical protein
MRNVVATMPLKTKTLSFSSVPFLSGCDLGDIACSDRHAYQRLVRGPFKAALTTEEEKRIKGVPDHVKHAVSRCQCCMAGLI